MTSNLHPWQVDPTELITTAIEHLHREKDSDNRIAFLLFDVGVETLFKIFLTLPEKTTGTKLGYAKRKEAAEGNFNDLCEGIVQAAGQRLYGIDIAYIQHYHSVRNRLYHEGIGITISTDQVKKYAQLSVDLLKRLLNVDLNDELHKPETEKANREQEEKEIAEQVMQIDQARRALAQAAAIAIEKIYPKLVLPSFTNVFKMLQDESRPPNPIEPSPSTALARGELAKAREQQLISEIYTYLDITELYLDIVESAIYTKAIPLPRWHLSYRNTASYPGNAMIEWTWYDDDTNELIHEIPSHKNILADGKKAVGELDGIRQIVEEWISKPNRVISLTRKNEKTKISETNQEKHSQTAIAYQQYFASTLERLKQMRPGITSASKTPYSNWFSFSAGRDGFEYGWAFRADGTLWVVLWIDSADLETNKAYFDALKKQESQIQSEIQIPIFWDRLDRNRQSRVRAVLPVTISDSQEHLELAKVWSVETTIRFIDTFQQRIKEL